MGINKNDATSFEEMAEEQAGVVSTPAEPVAETEPTVCDKPCDCSEPCADENCDCTTPKAE